MKHFNKTISILSFSIGLLLFNACGNNSDKNNSSDSKNYSGTSSSQQEQLKEDESIDGLYSYEDNSAKLTVTINGSTWSGKTIIISGFGSDYDAQNAQYDNGVVKGNDLYENSGMVKVGYVNGKYLTTSIGGQSVTLDKN